MRRLTEDEKEKIKHMFEYYKNKGVTLKTIANQFNVSSSLIGKIFLKKYGNNYRKISEFKSYQHCTKVNKNNLLRAFEMYKKGETIAKISKLFNIKEQSLKGRFYRTFIKEFKDLIKIKRLKNENICKKVSHKQIIESFEKYKHNKISLAELAKGLKISEPSLTIRFKNHFNNDYKEISKSRRDERKITKEGYIKAFEEYETTPISLTILANNLGVAISSLRPRFIRLFGERYNKIAKQKLSAIFLDKRGKLAEKLSFEYLKIIGIELEDIRGKCLIKNTLKRPDFISGETFIEVKSYFIRYTSKRLKGYKEILDSYLNKELIDGRILKFGMIISLSGFSDRVKQKALEDNITLIDYNDLDRKFDEFNKQDLIDLMEHHFLPRWES